MWGITKIEHAGLAESSLTVTCIYKFGHLFLEGLYTSLQADHLGLLLYCIVFSPSSVCSNVCQIDDLTGTTTFKIY